MEINKAVKNLKFTTTSHANLSFHDLKGKNIILYFYPKDDTPGCTQEGIEFRDLITEFTQLNTVILGVSRDDLASHEKFREKYNLPFDLITDKDETLCAYFNVIKMKNMYGKQVRGIERSTFFIDKDNVVRQVWRGVKAKGHAAEIIAMLKKQAA